MKRDLIVVAIMSLIAVPAFAGAHGALTGAYVEARTAEVFTGGCTMGSEAETVGRQAVLAWRIDQGSFNGEPLDGLSVVAAVVGDHNLGIREIGGDVPTLIKSTVMVDERATAAQRTALIAFAREISKGGLGDIVEVTAAPIRFADAPTRVEVAAGDAELAVAKVVRHNPSCGAMQWFHPLATVDQAAIGMTDSHAYSGNALGSRWSDPGKKSSFFGTFTY